MPKFRKKPVIIEAIQWSGDINNKEYMESWIESNNIQTRQVMFNTDGTLSKEQNETE